MLQLFRSKKSNSENKLKPNLSMSQGLSMLRKLEILHLVQNQGRKTHA